MTLGSSDPERRAVVNMVTEIGTGHAQVWRDRQEMASAPQVPALPDRAPHRLIITFCTVGATLMQALDQTIANVALPYMQGSLSATYDEITWVLTSYITAAAIMTAPVGWLAAR